MTQTPSVHITPAAPPNKMVRIAVKSAIQLVRYWWVIAIAMSIAMTAGVVLSKITSETTWSVQADLVYGRLPIDGAAERLYVPPDLRTVTSLLKSAAVLDRAIEIGKLDYSAHGLASSLTVEEPRGTQKIGLSIVTTSVDGGQHVLNSVIQAFQLHVADLRQSLISRNLQDLQVASTRNETRMNEIRTSLAEFAGAHQVRDVKIEVQSLTASLSSLEYQLNSRRIEEQSLRVQRQSVQQQLDQQKLDEQELSRDLKEAEAAEESLADNRRRQDRLNELIREERRRNEIRAKLEARQSEYDRKLVLFEKGYLSKNDFESITAEVEALKSQIAEGTQINEWKAELERIDKLVVPKAKTKRVGSPIIHQTMFKLVELDLGILASQEAQRQVTLLMAEHRQRLSELENFETEQAGLLAEMKSVSDERDNINSQESALQAVHDMGPIEFSVAQQPSANMRPPSSNRKKLFIMIFGGIACMLTSPIGLLAVATATRPSLLEFGEELGMATLSPRKTLLELFREMTPAEFLREQTLWCRQIGLRLQQLQPEKGAVFTFLPSVAATRKSDTQLLLQVAHTLARRDETVLVVALPGNDADAHADVSTPVVRSEATASSTIEGAGSYDDQQLESERRCPGLFDYAQESGIDFQQTLQVVSDRVHLVSGGQYDPDRLFSNRIHEFFQHARTSYFMVVVLGPLLSEQIDVEMMARHSDGLLLLHNRSDGLTRDMQRTIESLYELQAPVLGLATRAGAARRPRIRFSFGLSRRKVADNDGNADSPVTHAASEHPSQSAPAVSNGKKTSV